MRPASPWFRASKIAWFVELNGLQVRLGKHPLKAPPPKKSDKTGLWNPPAEILEAFHRLMAVTPTGLPAEGQFTVVRLFDQFLDHSHRHHTPDTYANYRYFLQSFSDANGAIPAADLKPFHVTYWLDAHPTWKGGRRHAVRAVKRAYSWADKQGLLSPNPVKHLETTASGRRTRVLTEDEQAEILGAIRDQEFRDFVVALSETGCRPSEVARVTAAHFQADLGLWVFDEHKTAKKTRRPRVIYLTPPLVEMSLRLADKYPDGLLFRGPRGGAFTRNNIRCRFRRLREKLPHLPPFVAYNFRHTFATRALLNQVPVAEVAALLGHADPGMVSRVYGHPAGQVEHMREAAKKAAGSNRAS